MTKKLYLGSKFWIKNHEKWVFSNLSAAKCNSLSVYLSFSSKWSLKMKIKTFGILKDDGLAWMVNTSAHQTIIQLNVEC